MAFLPGLAPTLPPLDEPDGDCWFTPAWLLEWLGPIALDPCWCEASLVRAAVTIDLRRGEDGLTTPWDRPLGEAGEPGGIIFVNPPFSDTARWLAKCRTEANRLGRVVVALVPALPGDGPWHAHVWPAARWVGYIAGRVAFAGISGETESKGRGHALVVYGPAYRANELVSGVQRRAKNHAQAPVWTLRVDGIQSHDAMTGEQPRLL